MRKSNNYQDPLNQAGQAEEAYALLETLFASAPVGLGFLDKELRYVRVNEALARINGLPIEAHLGKTPAELLPNLVQIDQMMAAWRRLLVTGEMMLNVEVSGETPAAPGKIGYWSSNWYPVRRSGEIIGIGVLVEDITARKQSEAALQESEARYSSLFANNHAVMLLIDPATGQIVDANPAACLFYGYSRAELQRLKITALNTLPPDQVAAEMERARLAQRQYFRFPHRLASGEIREVEVYSGPIKVQGRALLYSIIHDITERTRTREALRKNEATMRALLEFASDGIVISKSDGRITLANAKIEELFGYDRAELLDQPVELLIPEPLRQQHIAHRATYMINLESRLMGHGRLDLMGRRKDGSEFPVEVGLSHVEIEDELLVMSFVRNITERRQAQQAIERNAERIGRLQLMTAALSAASTPAEVGEVTVQQGITVLNARTGYLALLSEDGQALRMLATAGYPDGLTTSQQQLLNGPNASAEVVRTGRPIWLRSNQEVQARFPRLGRFRLPLGNEAMAILPLLGRERTLGAVGWSFAEPKEFSQDEQNLLLTMARQCALALERSQLYGAAQQEIAARRQAEEELKTSLREKEILLREIHHRVKNNLQAVSNLVYLQSAYTRDEPTRQVLLETQDRIKSIGLIHEKLYQTPNLAQLDFAEYISSLARHLVNSYKVNPAVITLQVDAAPVLLDVDTAVPLGVIINELISNALKHAFPPAARAGSGEQKGEIRIGLDRNGQNQFVLTISDNGVGLPAELDFTQTGSLGLQLVNMLVSHMKGTIELDRTGGTTFRIRFTLLPENTR